MSLAIPDKLKESVLLFEQKKLSPEDYQSDLSSIGQSLHRAAEGILDAEVSAEHPRLCEVKTQVAHHLLALMRSLEGLKEIGDLVLFPRYLEQFSSDWALLEGCSKNLKSLR